MVTVHVLRIHLFIYVRTYFLILLSVMYFLIRTIYMRSGCAESYVAIQNKCHICHN
ncbi:hypothetical protein C2G38_2125071 [Gigaspora rosea]|uniref:Uncharacterized protein n=1 Tax=Gigaspora rosea TaxID=44941 RepID=A0A397TWW2_9GLOM|nr:hypothetical protein C2G38_2125071 [Gigaspora rosea]